MYLNFNHSFIFSKYFVSIYWLLKMLTAFYLLIRPYELSTFFEFCRLAFDLCNKETFGETVYGLSGRSNSSNNLSSVILIVTIVKFSNICRFLFSSNFKISISANSIFLNFIILESIIFHFFLNRVI